MKGGHIIKKIISFFPKRIEIVKRKRLVKRLTNSNPKRLNVSIISNNCIAGCLYHDCGLRFLSPTINLYFEEQDYLKFISDFEYYISAQICEFFQSDKSFPVGTLGQGCKKIKVFFQHYASFKTAKLKWEERVKRINKDNIVFIWEIPHKLDENTIKTVLGLKKKVIVVSKIDKRYQNNTFVNLDIYDKNYYPGKSLDYITILSGKRYIDKIDYIHKLFGE